MASSKPLMSDAEIKRRKRLQAKISQTTGAIGLGALAATTVASRPGRKVLRQIPKVDRVLRKPPPRDPKRDRIKGGITPALAIAAGLGGVGSFNFAAYTKAESEKRRRATPVKKRDELAPEYGEVAKAWSPTTRQYDPEGKRDKRNGIAQAAAGTAGIGALGAGGVMHSRGVSQKRKSQGAAITSRNMKREARQTLRTSRKHRLDAKAGKYNYKLTGGDRDTLTLLPKKERKLITNIPKNEKRAARGLKQAGKQRSQAAASAKSSVKLGREASRSFKTAGALGAAGVAGIGVGEVIRHRRKSSSWASYSKRDTSAFGVVHD